MKDEKRIIVDGLKLLADKPHLFAIKGLVYKHVLFHTSIKGVPVPKEHQLYCLSVWDIEGSKWMVIKKSTDLEDIQKRINQLALGIK